MLSLMVVTLIKHCKYNTLTALQELLFTEQPLSTTEPKRIINYDPF
jgi:hypothetical protein